MGKIYCRGSIYGNILISKNDWLRNRFMDTTQGLVCKSLGVKKMSVRSEM